MLKRLGTLDRVLVLAMGPLWLACIAMNLGGGFNGRITADLPLPIAEAVDDGWAVWPATDSDAYPTVIASSDPSIEVGDQLVRIGDSDLRGVTTIMGLLSRASDELDEQLRVDLGFVHSGGQTQITLQQVPDPFWWTMLPAATTLGVFGLICLLGAPGWRFSRRAFLTAMFMGMFWTRFPMDQLYIDAVLRSVVAPLAGAFFCWFLCDLPERYPPRGRILLLIPWFFGIGFGVNWMQIWIPLPAFDPMLIRVSAWEGSVVVVLSVIVPTLVLTWNYRQSDLIERRQIKWIVYGTYIAMASVTASWARILIPGEAQDLFAVTMVFSVGLPLMLAAGPISFFVAVFGYRFLDINPLISSTTSYSILGVLVIAAVLVLVPHLSEAAASTMGVDPSSAQLVFSMALAGIAVPIHRSLLPRIDRFFFPERQAVDEGIHHLLEELSTEQDARGLTTLVGERLDTQFRPDSCVVYAVAGEGYEPVFAIGRAVPPVVEAASPLITTLRARTAPLAADRFSRKDRIEQLSEFERATLDTLGVAVVVPVRRRGALVAFLCLGPKRSGDIYTSTDLALLAAVVNAVATQLELINQEEINRESRLMQQDLRRYVPGAILKELEAGADLEPRERPVSVLFVDIRDYTSYSQRHQSHEVFATVNRYTKAVSSIVERFGGSVVEFNGDGMMAVFGAPTPQPEKERAAVSTGREIIATIQRLGKTGEAESISVGVGVATGSAFVGSIQAVDRMIWTALGNTTNLAARLQGLTRDLQAAMVIDLATERGAGDAAAGFDRRDQVEIRGRSDREDIFVLPLRPNAVR